MPRHGTGLESNVPVQRAAAAPLRDCSKQNPERCVQLHRPESRQPRGTTAAAHRQPQQRPPRPPGLRVPRRRTAPSRTRSSRVRPQVRFLPMGWQIAISPMLPGSEVWNAAQEERVSSPGARRALHSFPTAFHVLLLNLKCNSSCRLAFSPLAFCKRCARTLTRRVVNCAYIPADAASRLGWCPRRPPAQPMRRLSPKHLFQRVSSPAHAARSGSNGGWKTSSPPRAPLPPQTAALAPAPSLPGALNARFP